MDCAAQSMDLRFAQQSMDFRSIHGCATRELSMDLAKPWIARYNHPQIETLGTFHFCAVVFAYVHALISVATCTLRMN